VRYLSNSEASTFKRCRRRWWLAWYRHLQPAYKESNDARAQGGRVHEALAGLYDPVLPRNPIVVLAEVIERDQPQVPESAEPELVEALRASWTKQTDLERAMVEGYVEWLQETGADAELVVTQAERSLMAQLTETVVLLGRLDAEAYYLHTPEQLLFIDHKTTTSFDGLMKRLNQDEQLLTYFLLKRAHTDTEQHVTGALYNMLRKVKRTAMAKPPFYMRHTIRFNQAQVDTFTVRLIHLAKDIEQLVQWLDIAELRVQAQLAYPTPTKDCSWDCDFALVCPMFDDGSRAEDMIAAQFVETPLSIRYPELKELPNAAA
jgi:hypothetical protein